MIFFEYNKNIKNPELILAWDVSTGELETHIMPMAIFVWRPERKADSIEGMNNKALNRIRQIMNNRDLHQSFATIQKGAQKALQRLVTVKISKEHAHL